MKSRQFYSTQGYTDLREQVTDGDEFCFASYQASHFLECSLLFGTKRMRIFAVLIEPGMGAPKFVTPRISRYQMKILIEFVPNAATERGGAFQHSKSNFALFHRGLGGNIELEQCPVQIAPRKQQAQPLLGNPHAVDLKLGPHLGGSAKYPVRIKYNQGRLMIVSIGNSCGDDLLSPIAIQIAQHYGI